MKKEKETMKNIKENNVCVSHLDIIWGINFLCGFHG